MSQTDSRKTLSTEDIGNQKKISVAQGTSLERLPKSSDSQSIVINFYPNNFLPKIDKLIQTEVLESEEEEEEPVRYTKTQEKLASWEKKEAGTATASDFELLKTHERIRSLPTLARKISRQMSIQERKDEKLLDYRKPTSSEKSKSSIATNRTQSDLERKKLEAELKAAEEIAKLKQIVIEKRLAVELAALQNNFENEQKPTNSAASHRAELRKLDELAMRKQSMIETNLLQELETLDYQNRLMLQQQQQQQLPQQSQRPPPPPLPTRVPSPMLLKGTFKADSSSSVINSFKNLNILDKKINLDKKFSTDMRNPSPTNLYNANEARYDPRFMKKDERYNTYAAQPLSSEPKYAKMEQPGRPQWSWKSTITKIKKKIKPNNTRWTGE